MDRTFAKFFGLNLDCFCSRSQTLGLETCRSQSRSWCWKNYWVSVSTFVVSPTSLVKQIYQHLSFMSAMFAALQKLLPVLNFKSQILNEEVDIKSKF